jgi:hypothetical protein
MPVFSVPVLLLGLMLLAWSYLLAAGRTRVAQSNFHGRLGLSRIGAVALFGMTGILLIVGSIGWLTLPSGTARMTFDLVLAGLLGFLFAAWMLSVLRSGRSR